MALDAKLIDILACPQCKGKVKNIDGGQSLSCERCKIKYPIRDGIPIMTVEEALRPGTRGGSGSVRLPRVSFRVIKGPDINMSFQVEQGTCRAIGRAQVDPNKTSVFNVDISLELDESTKSLILQYIGRQFQKATGTTPAGGSELGIFRRAADIVFTDSSLSRLHAMVFAEEGAVGILDLVSKNGTFVNGNEIESTLLSRGDAIEFGETTVTYEG